MTPEKSTNHVPTATPAAPVDTAMLPVDWLDAGDNRVICIQKNNKNVRKIKYVANNGR